MTDLSSRICTEIAHTRREKLPLEIFVSGMYIDSRLGDVYINGDLDTKVECVILYNKMASKHRSTQTVSSIIGSVIGIYISLACIDIPILWTNIFKKNQL